MGKQKQAYIQLDGHRRRFILSIRGIFSFHSWRTIKKLFPCKLKHAQAVDDELGNTSLVGRISNAKTKVVEAGADNYLVKGRAQKTKPTKRKLGKSWIKALGAEESSKEEDTLSGCVDVQEDLNVNRSEKCVLNPHLDTIQASDTRVRLIKSGSFPTENSFISRNYRLSSLEHKQKEKWASRNANKLYHAWIWASNFVAATSSSAERNVMEEDGSDDYHAFMCKAHPVRSMSLNDSLDRYSQLFERTFKDQNLPHSRSLRLKDEAGFSSDQYVSTSSKRNLSLRNIDSKLDIIKSDDGFNDLKLEDPNTEGSTSHGHSNEMVESEVGDGTFKLVEPSEVSVSNMCLENTETVPPRDATPEASMNVEDEETIDPGGDDAWNVLEALSSFKCSSLSRLLSPSLSAEMEARLARETECPKLLFDLITEALMAAYERSCGCCWPAALFFGCDIHPVPAWHRVLEEACAGSLSSGSKQAGSTDCVVQDLGRGDEWMNLQFEGESVGIELGDLIFDQILDEILCL